MTKPPITSPLADDDKRTAGRALQSTLVDLIDLSLIAKQAHWNVMGPHFRSVHLHLDEVVTMARGFSDEVAERAVAIGVSPNGTARGVAEMSGLSGIPTDWVSDVDVLAHMVGILGELAGRLRGHIDETDKSDLVTQDLLIGIAHQVEKQHWMWQAHQGSGRTMTD